MLRIDLPSTNKGFEEFESTIKDYLDTGKMKLLITPDGQAVLRRNVATKYDSYVITGLTDEQVQKLEGYKGRIKILHPCRVFWDETVKERAE